MPVEQGLPWHPVATALAGQAIPFVVTASHAHALPSAPFWFPVAAVQVASPASLCPSSLSAVPALVPPGVAPAFCMSVLLLPLSVGAPECPCRAPTRVPPACPPPPPPVRGFHISVRPSHMGQRRKCGLEPPAPGPMRLLGPVAKGMPPQDRLCVSPSQVLFDGTWSQWGGGGGCGVASPLIIGRQCPIGVAHRRARHAFRDTQRRHRSLSLGKGVHTPSALLSSPPPPLARRTRGRVRDTKGDALGPWHWGVPCVWGGGMRTL